MSYRSKIFNTLAEDYVNKITLDLYGEEGPDDKLLVSRIATGLKNTFAGLGHDDRMAKDVFDKMKDYKRYFTELKERHSKMQHKVEPIRNEKICKKLAIFHAMGNTEISLNSFRDFIMAPYEMLVEDGTVDIVVDWLTDMRTMAPSLKNNGMLDEIRKIQVPAVQEWIPDNCIFAMPTTYIGDKTIILAIKPIDKQIHETLRRSTSVNIANNIRRATNTALRTDGFKYDDQETGKISWDNVSFESVALGPEFYKDKAYKTLSAHDAEGLLELGLEICDLEYRLRKKLDTLEKTLSTIDPSSMSNAWKVWKAYKFVYTFPKLRNFIRGNTYHLADALELIKDLYLECTESEDNHVGMGLDDPEHKDKEEDNLFERAGKAISSKFNNAVDYVNKRTAGRDDKK